ncbi:MAG TPA: ABC transporter permease [Thermoanaerobaculia bacterium]|nr:ABC transporter permease [Thermoanaerobaculia bacterium]
MRTYLLEAKYEFLKALRNPAYALPTILFPVIFYYFFGVIFGAKQTGHVKMAEYLLATYGAFGVIGAALFGFGVTVAIERGHGWLDAKRTTPMPIASYFVAKLAMAMIFSAIIMLLLFAMAALFTNVSLSPVEAATLFVTCIAGSITFCALGLAVGFMAGPSSAAPIVNVIYLPMAMISGLWVPIQFLPETMQHFAYWMPPYHFSQLALRTIGASRGEPVLLHVAVMAGSALLFAAIAYAGYRRETGAAAV